MTRREPGRQSAVRSAVRSALRSAVPSAVRTVAAKTPIWAGYLLGGLLAIPVCVRLPLGIGRDLVYCLIGASGAVAIMVGVRRSRPRHPVAWYLIAGGTATWVLGDGLYGWYEHVALIEPFPSPADALYLAAYPLFAAGLWVLVRSRGQEHGLTAFLDAAILTIGLGIVSWVFLVQPSQFANDKTTLSRLVAMAYPFADVVLLALLLWAATAVGRWNAAARLVAGSVAALLAADSLYAASAFVPTIADQTQLLDSGWLVSYVLWGAAALHPSMRRLSAPAPERAETMSTTRLLALVVAVAIGPAILAAQTIASVPTQNVAVAISSGMLMPLIFIRMISMVRQLEDQAARLGQLADTDYGTGLASRRSFTNRLGELLEDADGQKVGLLLIEVERFAEINDTLGQRTGDAIMHAVGLRLGELTSRREPVGGLALVARMGSQTLGVLDPSIGSDEQAYTAAVGIRQALERPLKLPDLFVSVEVSIGLLVLPEDGAEPAVALLRADVALSVARARPERTARYGVEMEVGGTLAPLLIGELQKAIEGGDIVVHFQPQVEIRTGRVIGAEALVRWQHPRHGLLGPESFVAAAEQTGLIGLLTQHVLDTALHECAGWQRQGLDLTVAVNLSVRNLLDPGLVATARAALERHGLEARSLELEITEGSAMVNPRRSLQVLGALAEMGVNLSIDDYGTGHSSLAYLQRLPVKRLKLDRSFVTYMVNDEGDAAIVLSTIKLARVLRLNVVAEGVEDNVTLLMLRDMECFAVQGYGIGLPVAASLLPELIRDIEERLRSLLGIPSISGSRP